jgi:hypothetical protein
MQVPEQLLDEPQPPVVQPVFGVHVPIAAPEHEYVLSAQSDTPRQGSLQVPPDPATAPLQVAVNPQSAVVSQLEELPTIASADVA